MNNLNIRRASFTLGLCAVALGSLTASAHATPAQFNGLWVNLNPATNNIVRFLVIPTPGGPRVHTYGKCSPTPCDWGQVPLVTYGNNIADTDHKHGTAVYSFGFATTAMTFQLLDATTMEVHTYNQFLDGSGRQNFHTVERFRKLSIIVDPVPVPFH
jgi:hypothetical protein